MNERGTFETTREGLLDAIRGGASIVEAATTVGVSVHTVRTWLARGRKEPAGRYGSFAEVVAALRQARTLPTREALRVLTRDEIEGLLAESARRGSVPAMRLWVDIHRDEFEPHPDERDPFAEFDPS